MCVAMAWLRVGYVGAAIGGSIRPGHSIKVGKDVRAPSWVRNKGKPTAAAGEGGEGGGVGLPPQYRRNGYEFRRGNSTIVSGSAKPTRLTPA